MTKFRQFIRLLKANGELQAYADACGYKVYYLSTKLYKAYANARPKSRLLLIKHSNGFLKKKDLIDHFDLKLHEERRKYKKEQKK